ncbi:MAG: BatD family protein [Prevotella sp.]|nr:BatD family protein [Prevotella sp.]
MKQKLFYIAQLLCLLLFNGAAKAQSVESAISSTQMLIGEQVAIRVTAHAKDTSHVSFPEELLLPTEVELLTAIPGDDVNEGNGMTARSRSYVLTSFTDADTLFSLPPIQVMIDGKEYATKPLALKLMTIEVDTTKIDKFNGPKDIRNLPFSWDDDDWNRILPASIAILLLLILGVFLLVCLISNKPIISRIRIIKLIPPHQKAMKAIEEIKAERMATAEDPKEYYTKLTDALRQYINERYGFNAMEMTSSEIIERLMQADDPKSLEELKQLFQTADLVKFAKYSTLINENDANLVSAIDFINETKQENVPTEEIIKPELTAQQQRSKTNRRILIGVIAIIALAVMALLTYVIWTVYDLLN